MGDRTKDTTLFIFIILTVVSLIFAFNTHIKADKNKKSFEKEMAFRLDMEELVSKLREEKIDLTSTLKDKELEIQRKNQLVVNLNLENTSLKEDNEKLKSELEKMTLLKEKMEDNLKEALSQAKRETK